MTGLDNWLQNAVREIPTKGVGRVLVEARAAELRHVVKELERLDNPVVAKIEQKLRERAELLERLAISASVSKWD